MENLAKPLQSNICAFSGVRCQITLSPLPSVTLGPLVLSSFYHDDMVTEMNPLSTGANTWGRNPMSIP